LVVEELLRHSVDSVAVEMEQDNLAVVVVADIPAEIAATLVVVAEVL
jgi:hypothetical protein